MRFLFLELVGWEFQMKRKKNEQLLRDLLRFLQRAKNLRGFSLVSFQAGRRVLGFSRGLFTFSQSLAKLVILAT